MARICYLYVALYIGMQGVIVFHVQPEDGHCQAPKHVAVPYVVNTIYTPLPSNKIVLTST